MMNRFSKIFSNYKDSRTQKANINIILSFIFRGGSIILQFALVPLTIHYLKADKYGVWITIFSVVSWIAMLDIGIANGLKNNLSKALAEKDYIAAKGYVSLTYVLLSICGLAAFLIFYIVSYFVKWQAVFNAPFIPEIELQRIMVVVFVFFILKFIVDILNIIAASFQHTSLSSVVLFISNVFMLTALWLMSIKKESSLLLLATVFSVIPFIVSLCASVYLFFKNYAVVRPSFKFIDFSKSSGIVSLGSRFFILQIASLIIFQTDNILITNLFNAKEVTVFNTVYKYYSTVIILFSMIMAPYWTAFTDAYFKRDFPWLEKTVSNLIRIWCWSLIPLVLLLLFAKFIIGIWIGKDISFDWKLSASIFAYVAIFNWNSIWGSFLNGVGKIRLQIILVIIVGVINIPLIVTLVKVLKLGVFAVPLSNFACLILGAVIGYLQYKKIANQTASGIWNS